MSFGPALLKARVFDLGLSLTQNRPQSAVGYNSLLDIEFCGWELSAPGFAPVRPKARGHFPAMFWLFGRPLNDVAGVVSLS